MDEIVRAWGGRNGSRYSRRSLLRRAAAGSSLLLATGVAACGGARQTSSAGSKQSGAAPAEGTPARGGTINLAVPDNPPTWDPHRTTASFTKTQLGLLTSRLLQFDTGRDASVAESFTTRSDLALTVESPDAVTWTVKLRPDAKFHNIPPVNGHAVEADDVKATFVRAIDAQNPNSAEFAMIDPAGITTPARDTVVFKLKYAYAPFPSIMASNFALILPREAAGGAYDPAKQPIGSGPFMLDTYTPDVAVVYKRNPDWYEKGRPYVDGVRYAITADPAQQLAQLLSGNLDSVSPIDLNNLDTVRRTNPKIVLSTLRGTDNFYVYTQLGVPSSPFLDIRVRRAMSLAIDRASLAKVVIPVGSSYLQPVVGLGWGKWALTMDELPADTAQWYKYNPDEAKKLLDAAGAGGLTLKFNETKPQSRGQRYYTTAETVFNMLGALPWKISLVTIDYNNVWVAGGKGVRYGNFPTDTLGLSGLERAADIDEHLFGHFDSQSSKNLTRVHDSKFDALIDKARATVDPNERVKAFKDAQQYLAVQLYGLSGFPDAPTYTGWSPRVRGWTVAGSEGAGTEVWSKVWLQA